MMDNPTADSRRPATLVLKGEGITVRPYRLLLENLDFEAVRSHPQRKIRLRAHGETTGQLRPLPESHETYLEDDFETRATFPA